MPDTRAQTANITGNRARAHLIVRFLPLPSWAGEASRTFARTNIVSKSFGNSGGSPTDRSSSVGLQRNRDGRKGISTSIWDIVDASREKRFVKWRRKLD